MKIMIPLHRFRMLNLSFRNASLAIVAAAALAGCSETPDENTDSHLYFSVKTIGPSVNIYSLDNAGVLNKNTDDQRWRDLEMDVSNGGDLVFLSNRKSEVKIDLNKQGENLDLFLLPKATGVLQRLTDDQVTELSPKFNPAGNAIAYIRHGEAQHELVLRKLDDAGTSQTLLTASEIANIDWAPDGSNLAVSYLEGDESRIGLLNTASGEIKVVLALPTKAPEESFKPNDYDSFMKKAGYLKWSPDGHKIAFIRNTLFRGTRQLHVLNVGSGEDKLVSPPEVQAQDGVSWSANSERLLFSGLVNYRFYYDEQQHHKVYQGGMQIFDYRYGQEAVQITSGDHLFKLPTFSPDEKRIAYFYAEKLGERIYELRTMKTDGSDIQTLQPKIAPVSPLIWQ